MQELIHYYKNIITLKSGVQIEIWTRHPYAKHPIWKGTHFIPGFIKNPLLVEKTIKFKYEEVAAIETVKDPCIAQVIPWPEEIDVMSNIPLSADQVEERDGLIQRKKLKPMDEHKSTCAFILAAEAGKISSEVTQCDCGCDCS